MTQTINLTPHEIKMVERTNNAAFDWVTTKTYPKAEKPARVKVHEIPNTDMVDGFHVSETFASTKVENLPEQKEGVYYIVSRQVMDARPDRNDLLIVNGAVRNDEGKIIGVTGFARIVEPKEWVLTDNGVFHIDEYDQSNPDHGFPVEYYKTKQDALDNLVMPE